MSCSKECLHHSRNANSSNQCRERGPSSASQDEAMGSSTVGRQLGCEHLLNCQKTVYLCRSSQSQDLYVAPLIEPVEPCDVKIAFGDVAFDCQRHFLQANSGYFAAAMRHGWQDWQTGPASGETYRFHDFPGGRAAFSLAMSWFACSKCYAKQENQH